MAEERGLNNTWLRALNNILVLRTETDPQAARALVDAGMALARRMGDERWVAGLVVQVVYIYWRSGGWESALQQVDRILAETSDTRSRINLVASAAMLRASPGASIDPAIDELKAIAAETNFRRSEMTIIDTEGWKALSEGRLGEVATAWARVAEDAPTVSFFNAQWMAHMAIWSNDPDAVERWAALHWEYVPHGGAAEIDHLSLQAAIRGLRGDRTGAAATYREALGRYGGLGLEIDLGFTAIDMCYILGPTDPLTLEAISVGRSAFQANRARTFLDLLEAAVASGPHTVSRADDPRSSDRAAKKAGVPAP